MGQQKHTHHSGQLSVLAVPCSQLFKQTYRYNLLDHTKLALVKTEDAYHTDVLTAESHHFSGSEEELPGTAEVLAVGPHHNYYLLHYTMFALVQTEHAHHKLPACWTPPQYTHHKVLPAGPHHFLLDHTIKKYYLQNSHIIADTEVLPAGPRHNMRIIVDILPAGPQHLPGSAEVLTSGPHHNMNIIADSFQVQPAEPHYNTHIIVDSLQEHTHHKELPAGPHHHEHHIEILLAGPQHNTHTHHYGHFQEPHHNTFIIADIIQVNRFQGSHHNTHIIYYLLDHTMWTMSWQKYFLLDNGTECDRQTDRLTD
ncbi:hypothetical protein DPMN_007236 [Dreissena polymorpha]|uniref:Uncharacterized protein n=1 Tax=Dreissena polymorpha TaxID=45954 RepID=A0A9D4MVI5_DREPO|nr:hypothetical protein DPMN_007236 [Dreissena polymorpha]